MIGCAGIQAAILILDIVYGLAATLRGVGGGGWVGVDSHSSSILTVVGIYL